MNASFAFAIASSSAVDVATNCPPARARRRTGEVPREEVVGRRARRQVDEVVDEREGVLAEGAAVVLDEELDRLPLDDERHRGVEQLDRLGVVAHSFPPTVSSTSPSHNPAAAARPPGSTRLTTTPRLPSSARSLSVTPAPTATGGTAAPRTGDASARVRRTRRPTPSST